MKYECPKCSRTIFNRRLDNCEFCGSQIPDELKLSESDIRKLEEEHQISMRRESEIEQPKHFSGGTSF